MDETRLLWHTSEMKLLLSRLLRDIEAGLGTSVAFEMALRDIDILYRKTCALENVQPINHMLQAPSVELTARFALDALFGALKGHCTESEARSAFWAIFRKATNPALTPGQ